MGCYSHSRLGTYQQCKYKYKLQYIDKVKVEIPTTIEAFMGSCVHEALEKLYKDLQHEKLNSKEELLAFYEERWNAQWSDDILIVNKDYTKDNYFDMGKRFIVEYYDHYKPFNHLKTLGLETEDRLDLGNGHQYHIRIDRLACDSSGNYYVCDYKTNNKLKAQEELDEDKQLAMYSLWVKNNFSDCKQVKLVWYFLAFDKEMVSERSDEQLEQLKNDTCSLIADVESCSDFPTNVTALCGWCKFKSLCPAWKHELELEKKTPEEFKDDDGVKLVDELATLEATKKDASARIEEIKEKVTAFAKQKGIEVVFGTNAKASVKPYEKIEYPKTQEFLDLLKAKGLYDELVSLNSFKLKARLKKLDQDIRNQVKTEESYTVRLGKR